MKKILLTLIGFRIISTAADRRLSERSYDRSNIDSNSAAREIFSTVVLVTYYKNRNNLLSTSISFNWM